MYRHQKYTDAQRALATRARSKAGKRDVLYHGTRYPRSILESGILLRATSPSCQVCLTRSPEVAAYWAMMDRRDDEGRPTIFILDRASLASKYTLSPNPEPYWLSSTLFHDEAEEAIFANVIGIGDHLVGMVSGRRALLSQANKKLNRRYMAQIKSRLRRLQPTAGAPAFSSHFLGA
jgi:hypothetical protein